VILLEENLLGQDFVRGDRFEIAEAVSPTEWRGARFQVELPKRADRIPELIDATL